MCAGCCHRVCSVRKDTNDPYGSCYCGECWTHYEQQQQSVATAPTEASSRNAPSNGTKRVSSVLGGAANSMSDRAADGKFQTQSTEGVQPELMSRRVNSRWERMNRDALYMHENGKDQVLLIRVGPNGGRNGGVRYVRCQCSSIHAGCISVLNPMLVCRCWCRCWSPWSPWSHWNHMLV